MAHLQRNPGGAGGRQGSIKAFSISNEIEESGNSSTGEGIDRSRDSASELRLSTSTLNEITRAGKDGRSEATLEDIAMMDKKKRDVLALIFGTSYNQDTEEHSDAVIVWLGPRDKTRGQWDAFFMTMVLFSLWYWPLYCAFQSGQVHALYIFDKFVNLVCIADVVLNFNTGYNDGGMIELRQKQVRNHYLSKRFIIDLYSSVPIDMLMFFSKSLRYERPTSLIFRLESIVRNMFRLPRLVSYLSKWEDQIKLDANVLRVGKLVGVILLFAHTNACIQYLCARIEEFPDESWVTRNDLINAKDSMKYTVALFNALSHMLCIGYGSHGEQTAPYTDAEVFITIMSMVVGASFYVVLVGIIASIVLSMDHSGAAFKEKIDIWRQYSQYRQLPKDIRDRVFKYFEHRWHTRKVFEENELLSQLPKGLSGDIKMFRSEYLLNRVPIFKLCHPAIVRTVVSSLKPMSCLAQEVVYIAGQMAEEMYFILKGEVQILSKESNLITTLSDGSYFGEFPMIFDEVKTRTGTAKCTTWTKLYTLDKGDFNDIVEVYPELLSVMRQIAEARKVHTSGISTEPKNIGDGLAEVEDTETEAEKTDNEAH